MPLNKFSINIEKSIKNLIKKEGYLTYEVDKKIIATNGGSYLGDLYEIDVKGKTKDGDKVTSLFLKVNNGSDTASYLFYNEVYQMELFAYKELSEVFAELQEDANVPSPERYKFVKSYEGSSTEAIILENIARRGFKTYNRMDVVSLEFAEKSMKELAKLHGLSFALQEKRPDYFDSHIKELRYPLIYSDHWPKQLKSMINLTIKYLDDDVKSKVEHMYYKLEDKYAQFFEDEETRRCICHGDYRSNNIMIKINDGKTTDFMVLDYQLLHYGCPAMDVIYFLFISTDQNFRSSHLAHLNDVYHETLSTFLKYFNIDVETVYSRAMFERDFKEKLDYGLAVGFASLPFVLVNEDDVPDITGDTTGINFQISDVYKDRQRGMIEEFIKLGYM